MEESLLPYAYPVAGGSALQAGPALFTAVVMTGANNGW